VTKITCSVAASRAWGHHILDEGAIDDWKQWVGCGKHGLIEEFVHAHAMGVKLHQASAMGDTFCKMVCSISNPRT